MFIAVVRCVCVCVIQSYSFGANGTLALSHLECEDHPPLKGRHLPSLKVGL